MENTTNSTFFQDHSVIGAENYEGSTSNPFLREIEMADNGDNTYSFLQKKLADANETITSYSQQESNLKCDIEKLSSENEDLTRQVTGLKSEVDAFRTKYITADQKLQGELRSRNVLQEKIKEKEGELLQEKAHVKKCESYVREMRNKVSAYENELDTFQEFVKKSFQCRDILMTNTKEQNDVLARSKEVISMLVSQRSQLSEKVSALESDFVNYESHYEELSTEVENLKAESTKQETYIKSILDSFKELDMHFNNMKTYYNQQKAKVDATQREIVQKCSKEEILKGDAVAKVNEMEKYKKEVQENERKNVEKIAKLEETLDSMIKIRHQLEETNKTLEKDNQELREENIEVRGKMESLQTVLNLEHQKCQDAEQRADQHLKDFQECQQQLHECQEKQRTLEDEVNNQHGAKNILNETISNLEVKQSQLQNDVAGFKNDSKFLSEENTSLRDNLKKTEKDLKLLYQEREESKLSMKERYHQISSLQQELDKVTSNNEILTQECQEKSCKLEGMQQTCRDHEMKIQTLEDKLAQCQLIFIENENKLHDLKGQLHITRKENTDKDNIAEKMSKMLTELKTAYDNSLQKVENLKGEMQTHAMEFQHFQSQKENEKLKLVEDVKRITIVVQEQEKEYEKQNKMKEDAIYTLNNKLKQLADIVDTDKDQINQLHERINFLTSKNEELNNELKNISDKREQQEINIDELEAAKKKLCEELQNTKDQYKDAKTELNEKTAELNRFKDEVETFEKLWNKQQSQALQELQAVLGTPVRNHSNDLLS